MVATSKIVKLAAQDMCPKSTLSFQPEYYECSTCIEIPADLKILECPVCGTLTCKKCLEQYTSKDKNKVAPGNYNCVVCHKDYKMKEPN
jgi:hypothetical protein